MARQPWESRDYDEPEWDPSQAGPEYHLNKRAPPRCVLCNHAMLWEVDEIGPYMRCQNRRCYYHTHIERP